MSRRSPAKADQYFSFSPSLPILQTSLFACFPIKLWYSAFSRRPRALLFDKHFAAGNSLRPVHSAHPVQSLRLFQRERASGPLRRLCGSARPIRFPWPAKVSQSQSNPVAPSPSPQTLAAEAVWFAAALGPSPSLPSFPYVQSCATVRLSPTQSHQFTPSTLCPPGPSHGCHRCFAWIKLKFVKVL